MTGLHWLLRTSRWARRPPSARRVLLVIAVVALCLALAIAETAGWLPGWAQAQRRPARLDL